MERNFDTVNKEYMQRCAELGDLEYRKEALLQVLHKLQQEGQILKAAQIPAVAPTTTQSADHTEKAE
jgi:NADH:ubiquinone oxidoreductase subunit E